MRELQEEEIQIDLADWCSNAAQEASLADCAILDVVNNLKDQVEGITKGLDVLFIIFSGSLVLTMQIGFAMLCAGSVQAKNVRNTMLKNFLDLCVCAVTFFFVGFAFAYGDEDEEGGSVSFIGTTSFFLNDVTEGKDYARFFIQVGFAASTTTIVCCSIVERSRFVAYIWYSIFLSGFVYPVVARSIWSPSGFLSAHGGDDKDLFLGVGVIDWAGSGVVHITGGCTALVGAIILGPRIGRFYDEHGDILDEPRHFAAHSVSLQMLGTFILWFGWVGFNAGSTGMISDDEKSTVAALAVVTTILGAASGGVSGLFVDTLWEMKRTGAVSYDPVIAMNGSLSGLVSVTAGCSVVAPWAAVVIGMVGGTFYVFSTRFLVRLRVDDVVDASPVHLCSGIWGLLAVGLFAEKSRLEAAGFNSAHSGWFYSWGEGSGDATLLAAQIVGALWVAGWSTITMTPFFYTINILGYFRVSPETELRGIDKGKHGGTAYAYEIEHDNLLNLSRSSSKMIVDLDMPGLSGGDEATHNARAKLQKAGGSMLTLLKAEMSEEMGSSYPPNSDGDGVDDSAARFGLARGSSIMKLLEQPGTIEEHVRTDEQDHTPVARRSIMKKTEESKR